jgi:chorismate dehydratase
LRPQLKFGVEERLTDMSLKVGRIPYMICEPFYFDTERRGMQLVDTMPARAVEDIEQGIIDAALVPVVDTYGKEELLQPVGGFCIASTDRAGSVFLYSKVPVAELGGSRIGLIDDSKTSTKLLKVLLERKYQVAPAEYVGLRDEHDAFLVMGDRGLRQRRGARGFPHRYDLGEEWFQWTRLPFVYARWMARQGIDSQQLAVLEDTLYVGLEDGVDNLYHISEPRENLLMLPRDVVEYVQGIRFYLGMTEQKSMRIFREYVEQLNA